MMWDPAIFRIMDPPNYDSQKFASPWFTKHDLIQKSLIRYISNLALILVAEVSILFGKENKTKLPIFYTTSRKLNKDIVFKSLLF